VYLSCAAKLTPPSTASEATKKAAKMLLGEMNDMEPPVGEAPVSADRGQNDKGDGNLRDANDCRPARTNCSIAIRMTFGAAMIAQTIGN
jgi:hypothetical protein